uniref:L1 transposable element RRM domain-containing protein n=1 Tax=Astyanax mexicanus TaxID=7994 RepID=A0A3B1K9Q6_ASTMX
MCRPVQGLSQNSPNSNATSYILDLSRHAMKGDKSKKGRIKPQAKSEREMEKKNPNTAFGAKDGAAADEEPATLSSIRQVVSEVTAAATLELKRELAEFRESFTADIKKQLNDLSAEIHQKIQDTSNRIDDAVKRLGEVEESMADTKTWDIGVKEALTQLLINQRDLRAKITDLEGRSRRNNIRLYGVPEKAEGSSMVAFVEGLIKTELGDCAGLNTERDAGIERAHRSLAPQPPNGAPPRSIVVRFLRFSVKERILQAAWKKAIHVKEVQKKRKEYAPIKRMLKDEGIRFQSPLSKLRVHFDTGPVTFQSASHAAEELRRRGFHLDSMVTSKPSGITEETLTKLLPWNITRGVFTAAALL